MLHIDIFALKGYFSSLIIALTKSLLQFLYIALITAEISMS